MMNHEVAVNAICEAKAILMDAEMGINVEAVSGKALELLLLSLELSGDDKNAVYGAAHILDSVVNHPFFIGDEKALMLAIEALNGSLAKADVRLVQDDEWVEPTAEELQKASDDADVDDAYEAAMEVIENELSRLDDELFECEYGNRKDDEDAYEQAYQLKADIRYVKKARAAIEDALNDYNHNNIDVFTATDIMYAKSNQF